jgi:hypothetical protein
LHLATLGQAQDSSLATGPPSGTQSRTEAAPTAPAETDQAELAKKLSNPIASLISVPFQNNYDFRLGMKQDGFRYTMNFQPVIPIALTPHWNVISRTIVPVMYQDNVVGIFSQAGLGDTVQSFFFSPNKTQPFIWGLGPALLIPTATDDLLGSKKFGVGPTLVVLKQQKGWTVGTLMNHIWSVAGPDTRPSVNSTFIQPFISYSTKTAWTFSLNTESTYNWTAEQWSVPVHLSASKLLRFGTQMVQVGGGPRCWATSPGGAPKGCGFRAVVTPLFPRK